MFSKSNLNFTIYSLCFLIIFIGVLFRIYNINHDTFWWDEILSFWIADPEISLRETLLRHYQLDSTLPTFNIILKYFYKIFGYKISVGRYLSAILGIFSFILISIISLQFKNKKSFLLLLFLSSWNIYLISASQEMRAYSMLIFFSISTIFLLYKTLEDSEKGKNIFYVVCFALSQVFAILVHPFSLILFFSIVTFLGISYSAYNKKFKYLSISCVAIFIFSLFFIFFYLSNFVAYPSWIQQIDLFKFLTNLYFSKFFGSRIMGLIHLIVLIFLIFNFKNKLFHSFDKRLLLLIFIFFSYFLPITYGFLHQPILSEKYIIFVIIPILIILSNLLFEIKNSFLRKFLILIIVIPTVLNSFTESTVKQFFEQRQVYKPDFYSTFNVIEKSNNKNFLFSLKERDSKVGSSILDALDNFVIKYSKENNFKFKHHRSLNQNLINENSFWLICLYDVNFNCADPEIEKRSTVTKKFNFNRINLKLLNLNR